MDPQHKELYNSLTELIEGQIKVYRSLLEVVRREKDILVSADLDDLNENNRAKEAMLVKIKKMETERISLAAHFAKVLNLDPAQPRLLEMANHLPLEMGDRLRNLHSVLELLLKRVQEYNQHNEVLVQSALENLTGAMKALRDTLTDKPTYKNKGAMDNKAAAPTGQLVSREA